MIRCLLFGHDIGAPVKRDGGVRWRCARCDRLSPALDLPTLPPPERPVVTKASTVEKVVRLVKRA